jgi:hypothetical protein
MPNRYASGFKEGAGEKQSRFGGKSILLAIAGTATFISRSNSIGFVVESYPVPPN